MQPDTVTPTVVITHALGTNHDEICNPLLLKL